MANTAVLERSPYQASSALKERTMTPAEAEHIERIADNYRKLRFDSFDAYNSAKDGEPVDLADPFAPVAAAAPVAEPVRRTSPAPAERLAQYTPVNAPAGRHTLFDDVVFKDGELQGNVPVADRAAEAVASPAAGLAAEDEDALPTRRTMDTLTRPAAAVAQNTETEERTGTFAALSTKLKVVLAAVAVAVIVAIVIICINTSLINSMSSNIVAKQAELESIQQQSQQIEARISELTSPENVAAWAEDHGMVLG